MRLALVLVMVLAAGCARSNAGAQHAERGDDTIRRLEAIQTRTPDWAFAMDGAALVAMTRTSSVFRTDIRPEVEAFLAANGRDLVDQPAGESSRELVCVTSEPTHVRYEQRVRGAVKRTVDARLEGELIVLRTDPV